MNASRKWLKAFLALGVSVAPPTQGTWRSNDYVNALRLVDGWFLY